MSMKYRRLVAALTFLAGCTYEDGRQASSLSWLHDLLRHFLQYSLHSTLILPLLPSYQVPPKENTRDASVSPLHILPRPCVPGKYPHSPATCAGGKSPTVDDVVLGPLSGG